jgi:hypothetical protein
MEKPSRPGSITSSRMAAGRIAGGKQPGERAVAVGLMMVR